ncbi:DUF883 family protein [Candidatus Woesearchaeota archaeon]|nr:DUF883 family protein [Candidatus Woesearchaeota archaeon]
MARARDDAAQELREFIKKAQEQLESLQDKGKDLLEEAKDKKETAEDFVKDNPLLALAGAFAIGYLAGRLLKRRRK